MRIPLDKIVHTHIYHQIIFLSSLYLWVSAASLSLAHIHTCARTYPPTPTFARARTHAQSILPSRSKKTILSRLWVASLSCRWHWKPFPAARLSISLKSIGWHHRGARILFTANRCPGVARGPNVVQMWSMCCCERQTSNREDVRLEENFSNFPLWSVGDWRRNQDMSDWTWPPNESDCHERSEAVRYTVHVKPLIIFLNLNYFLVCCIFT